MTAPPTDHICQYSTQLVWEPWRSAGSMRERVAKRIPLCGVCGRERPARRPRLVDCVERETSEPLAPPMPDPGARRLASLLLERCQRSSGGVVRVRTLLTGMSAVEVPASKVELLLEAFLAAGWIRVRSKAASRLRPWSVEIRSLDGLEEFAHPGLRAAREAALAAARADAHGRAHPVSEEVANVLASSAVRSMRPTLIRALGAVAVHVDSGETLAQRVFSVRYLGDSKALGRVRKPLERIVGKLGKLGIRDGAVLTLVGGSGRLRCAGQEVDCAKLRPFTGLATETLARLERIDVPPSGLVVVENLANFEACCRDEVSGLEGALVVWSAGYPGKGVRVLVEAASSRGARLRAWADMDLDGVRIARLVMAWAKGACEPAFMSREDLVAARASKRLTPQATAAIERDLARRPDAPLADTLRTLLETGRWVEQEALLGARVRG